MRWVVLFLTVFVASCSGINSTFQSLTANTTASVAGVATSVLTGSPLAGIAIGAGAGVAATEILPPSDTFADTLEAIPEEERAAVLKNHDMWAAVESLGYYALLGVLAFILLPLIVGYVLPNRKQKRMERMLFDDPNYSMRDMK